MTRPGNLPCVAVDNAVTWAGIGLAVVMAIAGLWLLFSEPSARSGAASKKGKSRKKSRKAPTRSRRPARDQFRSASPAADGSVAEEAPPPPKKRAAIILNSTHLEAVGAVRSRLARACLKHGWDEPLILETTAAEPGTTQTRRALAQEVDIVLALGGDGTVRAVAQALAGSATPLGILPVGHGTALARAVGLSAEDLDAAVETALTGQNTHVDVGWTTLDPTPQQVTGDTSDADNRHAFLVMSGFGLDATVLEETDPDLKSKVGWTAYVPAGVKNLLGERFRARVSIDGGPAMPMRARTIMVGNCGRLAGGVTLMPDAKIDDGLLDVLAVTPKGVAGWAGVAANVLAKTDKASSRMDRFTGTSVSITVETPQQVQMDGDVYGLASTVMMTVQPRGLIVRTENGTPAP